MLIVDWDVHHGNGTAELPSPVGSCSEYPPAGIYPGTGLMSDMGSGPGEGYTINLPVPGSSEEFLWLSLIEHIVVPVARALSPISC